MFFDEYENKKDVCMFFCFDHWKSEEGEGQRFFIHRTWLNDYYVLLGLILFVISLGVVVVVHTVHVFWQKSNHPRRLGNDKSPNWMNNTTPHSIGSYHLMVLTLTHSNLNHGYPLKNRNKESGFNRSIK